MILHGSSFGDPSLPPLVILHGLLGSSRNWLTVARRLSSHFCVHTLDLRNHGESPQTDTMSHAEMAEDLRETLAERRLERPWLLGHSLGGKIAMRFATDTPDALAGLIVEDIAPKAYPPHHQRDFEALLTMPLDEITSRKEADNRLAEVVPDWAHRQFLLTLLRRDGKGWSWGIPLRIIYLHQDALRADCLSATARYNGPTAFVLGEKSRFVCPEDYERIYQHFPKAIIHGISDAGHNVHFDQPDTFANWLQTFIQLAAH